MKNVSRRIAALTPSITVALILFSVGLTGLLAYRAADASRAQRQQTEKTLRDYAGFAAFQLKNFTFSRLATQHRVAVDSVFRWVGTHPPMPAMGAQRVADAVEFGRARCRCLPAPSFYYQVTFPDSGVEGSTSPASTPANLARLRDTVIAQAIAAAHEPAPVPGPAARPTLGPVSPTQFLVTVFSRIDSTPYVFAHLLLMNTPNTPLVAYGYAMPAERYVGDAVKFVLATQAVLPKTLTHGMAMDSILSVNVMDPAGRTVFATGSAIDPRYASVDTLDARQTGLRFEVGINPSAANRLIIGGLPRSRLPEVLATAFVSVCLLGLLLYQFRRQEELGRLRDDFVSGVSHELRTPLAQIRLLAELLRLGKVPTEEHKDRSLRIIDQEARRLSFLVESILNFTRSREATLSPVRTDITTEITEIVAGFEPLAQAQSVHVTTNLEPDLVAEVDRDALRQVLINLLDNAVRYGPPGQTVTIATARAGGSWTLAVADEGPGIPADERERIFAPYYRMKRDAGGAVGGTGIGLSVVRRLVKQHGGSVRVDADHRKGARLVVTLPEKADPSQSSG